MLLALAIAVALFAGGKADSPPNGCSAKCSQMITACEDHCAKTFPKAKAAECQKACRGSTDACLQNCRKK